MEQKGINPEGVGLVALALAYLTATPGKALKASFCMVNAGGSSHS